MTRIRPTARLAEEHKLVSQVVAAMALLADRLEMGQPVKRENLRSLVEFMRGFVDGLHEEKEESFLFPMLERRGVNVLSCPTRKLVREHQQARALVSAFWEAAASYEAKDPSTAKPLQDSLRRLVNLFPLHMWREDALLFSRADEVLEAEDELELNQAFDAAEAALGQDVYTRFQRLAAEIVGAARD